MKIHKNRREKIIQKKIERFIFLEPKYKLSTYKKINETFLILLTFILVAFSLLFKPFVNYQYFSYFFVAYLLFIPIIIFFTSFILDLYFIPRTYNKKIINKKDQKQIYYLFENRTLSFKNGVLHNFDFPAFLSFSFDLNEEHLKFLYDSNLTGLWYIEGERVNTDKGIEEFSKILKIKYKLNDF